MPTHLTVAALLRRVNDAGGLGVVRASGDAQSGSLLILLDEGMRVRALERMRDLDDRDTLVPAGPASGEERAVEEYWQARRARDPDLWVIELNVPHAERFVAETILHD
ncbi:MAG: DUF1491 family protein [Sphingomonas adhaesiva]|uniref:DUF1491 family protein n=1 Tax=Sphingomonas adhaesiva TaxID=28212 RepID=UPI002FF8EC69